MERNVHKIYCAGPLFNPKEREEMAGIAESLEGAGYRVFLPQRDGLEFAKLLHPLIERGMSQGDATRVLNLAIFDLDVFQVMDGDGLVLNMNGRVPDEGAMVEAGIAWSHGKPLVIYKNDDRSLIQGNCNPLVMGLSDFESVSVYADIPNAFDAKFEQAGMQVFETGKFQFDDAKEKGKEISNYLSEQKSDLEITELLLRLFREVACRA